MKKFFVTLFAVMVGMGAMAQEKGDFAVGVRGGANIAKIEMNGLNIDESTTRMGIGAFGQYSLTDHWRLELEGIYHPKKEHVSDITAGLNLHYLFHVSDVFKIYPQLGFALQFVNTEKYTDTNGSSTITVESSNSTDAGLQVGLGLQFNLGEHAFIGADYKFQPGIFGSSHVVMASVGYRF